ncbi:hypothetical protein [Leptolyngbya sp. FACHB-17]|uniref:hypothetical protein n=1 Tax=Leptolyngbya sp. FACHB-17 TaxID=2692803 RepID=UPI001A7E392A|nr:hypothetical protein [Leptolyngbya sp. FACHB-17]
MRVLTAQSFRGCSNGGRPDWVYENYIQYVDKHCLRAAEDAFRDGWSEGALSVWEQVKTQL